MPDITDKITQKYDASQIQVLEGLEAVRKQLPILSARRTDLYEVREH